MQMMKEELRDWYLQLNDESRMQVWKRFALFLNDWELKNCMEDVRAGKEDLFEIHFQHGYIEKYQIYFYQIMRSLFAGEGEE